VNRASQCGTNLLRAALFVCALWTLHGLPAGAQTEAQTVTPQQVATAQRELGDLPQYKGQVEKFYAAMGNHATWQQKGRLTRQGDALLLLFHNAAQKGLRPGDYGDWSVKAVKPSASQTEQRRLQIDVAMTVAAMRYVSDLHFGRVRPEVMGFALGAREKNFSLAEFLAEKVVHANNVAAAIATAEPPYPGYWRTLAALDRLEDVAATPGWKPLPFPKRSVHPGELYAALPDLAEKLRRMGDLPSNVPMSADRMGYQGAMVEAVRRFQGRHGLAADGVLGRATIAALNVPLSFRMDQLELMLERWRWIPQHLPLPMIAVNIPEFRLYVIGSDYKWLMVQKVILGKAYHHKTPVFLTQMQSVIFRPYWNVPLSIQRKELVPKIARDSGYLRRNDYEIVNLANHPVHVVMSGQTLAELRSGDLKVRQLPGDKNALGLIKFEFPNRYDVYMHGTPAQALFVHTRRDFSHGCIRLEHPAALAEWVLRDVPGWNAQRIEAATQGTETVKVDLPHPLPVLILYGTAVVTHGGEIRFLPDIYGYDARLKAALARQRIPIRAGP
jgi:murein L,D-transpeptidase YcbB/YkuD